MRRGWGSSRWGCRVLFRWRWTPESRSGLQTCAVSQSPSLHLFLVSRSPSRTPQEVLWPSTLFLFRFLASRALVDRTHSSFLRNQSHLRKLSYRRSRCRFVFLLGHLSEMPASSPSYLSNYLEHWNDRLFRSFPELGLQQQKFVSGKSAPDSSFS